MKDTQFSEDVQLLDLSFRAKQALKLNKILTIQDLLSYSKTDLGVLLGVGKNTREELISWAARNDLSYSTKDKFDNTKLWPYWNR